jgi:hypothetical protein
MVSSLSKVQDHLSCFETSATLSTQIQNNTPSTNMLSLISVAVCLFPQVHDPRRKGKATVMTRSNFDLFIFRSKGRQDLRQYYLTNSDETTADSQNAVSSMHANKQNLFITETLDPPLA